MTSILKKPDPIEDNGVQPDHSTPSDIPQEEPSGSIDPPNPPPLKKSVCVICIGMAGSGKTTFVQVCQSGSITSFHLSSLRSKDPQMINEKKMFCFFQFHVGCDLNCRLTKKIKMFAFTEIKLLPSYD